jgi:hypothetical protein
MGKNDRCPPTFRVGVRQDEQLNEEECAMHLHSYLASAAAASFATSLSAMTEARQAGLPSATDAVLLHPSRRHGWRRARHGNASGGVDNRNGIATVPGCSRLVQLQTGVLALKGRRDEGRRSRVE